MEIFEYLSQYREEIPEWIRNYTEDTKITFADVMSGRTSYYPGFGEDGSMLEAANRSHSVHSHILLDYWNSREEDRRQIARIKGYHSIGHIDWKISDILPLGFYRQNVKRKPMMGDGDFFPARSAPHYFTEILARDPDYDDSHGAERMALTILCADGIDFYYQLYIRQYDKVAWLFLLQDHGLGGNYDLFGKGGILDALMRANGHFPKFTICDNCKGTTIWDHYRKIEGLNPITGGMHRNVRHLYEYHGGRLPSICTTKKLAQMKSICFDAFRILDYYRKEFGNDLLKYFRMSSYIGGVNEIAGLKDMKPMILTGGSSMRPFRGCPAADMEKNFIFSGLFYYLLLIPRTIERLYGLRSKMDFAMDLGWPLWDRRYHGIYELLEEAALLPCDAGLENFLDMLTEVRRFMLHEMRCFLTREGNFSLDGEAHGRLTATIGPDIENFIAELSGLTDVFASRFRLLT